jgi:hypothetical protein
VTGLGKLIYKIVKRLLGGLIGQIADELEVLLIGRRIPEPIRFKSGDLLWEIIDEETGEVVDDRRAKNPISVYGSQTWILPLEGPKFKEDGVYQIRPRGWLTPLRRKIIILPGGGETKGGRGWTLIDALVNAAGRLVERVSRPN